MRKISTSLKNHLNSNVTTIAICLNLKLKNGKEMGFTSHQEDLEFQSVIYKSQGGLSIAVAHFNSSLSEDNLEFSSIISDDLISEKDILSGKFDHAEIELFFINYENFEQGKVIINSGMINEIHLKDGKFFAEVTGFSRKLSKSLAMLYSKNCNAEFGDSNCKINLAKLEKKCKVTNVLQDIIEIDLESENGHYDHGSIIFETGNNRGMSCEILLQHHLEKGSKLQLKTMAEFEIKIGDMAKIRPGCNKSFSSCKMKYDNILNFRGFPHVPGFDEMMKTAGTK